MSELSLRLSPVINKALLADGVQLTAKELVPVSVYVANYIKNNFDSVSKDVQAELDAEKKAAEEKAAVDKSAPKLQAPPPPATV